MTKANDLASLLDANGDVVSSALDNVPASDLVNDTTPQLGGNLDLFGNNITGNGRIDITSATSPQLKLSYSADTWLKLSQSGGATMLESKSGAGDGEIYLMGGQSGKSRMIVRTDGDVEFFNTDGVTKKMEWNATSNTLDVTGSVTATGATVALLDVASGTNTTLSVPSGVVAKFKGDITLNSLSTASSGNIESIYFQKSHTAGVNISNYDLGIITAYTGNGYTGGLDFYTGKSIGGGNYAATFAMRVDENQNLLVGTTDPLVGSNNQEGIALSAGSYGGYASFSRSGGESLDLNRKTNDGTILNFRKDGTTVGSIGTSSGSFYVDGGSGVSGVQFGVGDIRPRYNGALVDGSAADLGHPSNRWQNLYLSGGVVFGATGGAVISKTLDDYEEGTWTPGISAVSGSGGTTGGVGRYTKIGNQVIIAGHITPTNMGSLSGTFYVTGLPFTSRNQFIQSQGAVRSQGIGGTNHQSVSFEVLQASQNGRFHFHSSTGSQLVAQASDISVGDFVAFGLTYEV